MYASWLQIGMAGKLDTEAWYRENGERMLLHEGSCELAQPVKQAAKRKSLIL